MVTSDPTRLRLVDEISEQLAQLDVMLVMAHGNDENDSFTSLTWQARDTYLWACHEKVCRIQRAFDKLDVQVQRVAA